MEGKNMMIGDRYEVFWNPMLTELKEAKLTICHVYVYKTIKPEIAGIIS
jgi:hypothetical protein